MAEPVLHHVYLKPGDTCPEDLPRSPFHVAPREEGTGLDVWYWNYPDEDDDQL